MSSQKPTIVLLPGAWHQPFHYTLLTDSLKPQGYPIRSLKLPSVNPVDPGRHHTCSRRRLYAGNDVMIIAHSYGGSVAGAAAKGLGRGDRGERKSAVLGWIFLCALIGHAGKKMLNGKEQLAPWALLHEDTGICTIPDPVSCVYTHVDDAEAVKGATETIGTHSFTAFYSESPPQAWEDSEWDGRRVYVRCAQDQGVPVGVQDFLVESTQVKWEIESLEDAGHSPFMSHVGELTEMVEKYRKQWL